MTATCPHCGFLHEVGHHTSGTRVWCTICDGWFLVTFLPGGAQLTRCDPPSSWPKERRTKAGE